MSGPSAAGARMGLTAAITHEEEPTDELVTTLEASGIGVLRWPSVKTTRPRDPGRFRAAVDALDAYSWIVFTSRRAVAAVQLRRRTLPKGLQVAAVGSRVAAAIMAAGWPVHVVGVTDGSALAQALRFRLCGRDRVLFPAAEDGSSDLEVGLEGHPALLHRVAAYRTELLPLDSEACREVLEMDRVDAIAFLSPSAVRSVVSALEAEGCTEELFARPAVCIGGTTGRQARASGFRTVHQSSEMSKQAVGRLLAEVLGAAAAEEPQPSL